MDGISNAVVTMFLFSFMEGNSCTLTQEQKHALEHGELEEAIKNIKTYLPVTSMFVDAKSLDMLSALTDFLEIRYDSKPLDSNQTLAVLKQRIFYQDLQCIVIDMIGAENFQKFLYTISNEIETFFAQYPNFDKLIVDLLDTISGSSELKDYLTNTVDWMMLRNTPLTEIPQDLRLYHGTSLANWQMICKDGFLKPSDYTDTGEKEAEEPKNRLIAVANTIIESPELRRKYVDAHQLANGYVYFSYGLDDPLAFGDAGYRKNIFIHDPENTIKAVDMVSVILELQKPTKYEISINERNEFAVKGTIPIEDLKPFFVHRKDGVITAILDENGEDAYEYICYE